MVDKRRKSAIVLCSGGIDSVTTSYYVKKKLNYKNITILFFNYNQKNLKQERKFSKKTAKKLGADFKEINLKWLGNISTSLINKKGQTKKITRKNLKDSRKESNKFYVPCRNLVFLSYALALADSRYVKSKKKSDIFVGFKCEGKESYPDTTIKFVNKINNLAGSSCSKKFVVKAPLIKKDKEDIILLGKKLGVDFRETFTCYIGHKKHCGYCLACRLRQEGFYWADIRDPTKYKKKMKDFRTSNN